MKFTSFITFLALFSRLTPINGLNPFFSLIFIILAIFLLDRTMAKLRRTLGLVTIWPFFDQKWLFFDIFLTKRPYISSEITISKITSLFSSSILRDDINKVHLLTIYMAFKLKNGHFLVKNGHFWDFTHHIPHSALGWGQFRKKFFLTFAFFYVRLWHFGTLRFI